MPKYPTEWSYGIPRGCISDRKTTIMLNIKNTTTGIKFNKTYSISDYPSKKECLKFVQNQRIKKSHDLGLTRNELRFIDKHTVEVKLTQEKTFITDAKHLVMVNQYPLQAKAKKETGITRYYVMAQDKKKTFNFTKLITDYKIVEYINKDTLDLRENNMKEFGFDNKIPDNYDSNDDDDDNDKLFEDQSKYYFMPIEDLPVNKWVLGSVPGSLFFRKGEKKKILTLSLHDADGKLRRKTFQVSKYGSVKKTWMVASRYLINISHDLGIVKNKIRILDNNTIEIMLDDENIMLTDYVFLPLFIPDKVTHVSNLTLCKTFSALANSKIYANIYNRSTNEMMSFHKFIMGSSMIDHINNNTLDNRLCNLRFTTYSHNNSNRSQTTDDSCNGVILIEGGKYHYYRSAIKYQGKFYSKMFPLKRYGDDAKKLAIKFRKNILETNFHIPDDFSDIEFSNKDIKTIDKSIERTLEYQNHHFDKMIKTENEYLFGLDLDSELKSNMFNKYVIIQGHRYLLLSERVNKLRDLAERITHENPQVIEII